VLLIKGGLSDELKIVPRINSSVNNYFQDSTPDNLLLDRDLNSNKRGNNYNNNNYNKENIIEKMKSIPFDAEKECYVMDLDMIRRKYL
jgi:hypothetical protein